MLWEENHQDAARGVVGATGQQEQAGRSSANPVAAHDVPDYLRQAPQGVLGMPSLSMNAAPARIVLLCAFALLASLPARAQQPPAPPQPATPPAERPQARAVHRFWDRTNWMLFAGVGAARALDYASTRNLRARGLSEVLLTNEIVDNAAAFATIEAAGTAASIGVAYLFHRAGHHRFERWVSIIHITAATAGSARNYCLKTAHPLATAP